MNNFVIHSADTKKKHGKKFSSEEVQLLYTSDIDDFSIFVQTEKGQGSVWRFYKKLRKFALDRDEIGVLVRRFCLDMTWGQILADMNWTSRSMLDRRYSSALRKLKNRGFKK